MSKKRWITSIFCLMFWIVFVFCLAGCSETKSPQPIPNWGKSDTAGDFETQANRPPTLKTLWAIANILAKQGKDSECEFVLKRIIYEHPSFIPAYNSLAELKMRQGLTKEAIKTLHEGLKVDPKAPVLLNNLGMCWIILQDYGTALEMFTKAAGIRPENQKYRANMAVALGLMGRDEESLSLFSQILPTEQADQNLAVLKKARGGSDTNNSAPTERSETHGTESISQ